MSREPKELMDKFVRLNRKHIIPSNRERELYKRKEA